MLFVSRYAAYQQIVKSPFREEYWDNGVLRIRMKEFVAEFGGEPFHHFDADGKPMLHEDTDVPGEQMITQRGHVFDSDAAAHRLGWTAEEKEHIERELVRMAADPRMQVDYHLYAPPKPVPPWPTYDSMHHNTVLRFAEESGLANEALIYEQRTKRRPAVVDGLQALADKQAEAQNLVAAT